MIQVRRLGHATLTTPDLGRQVAYYTEVVGLTLHLVEHEIDGVVLPELQHIAFEVKDWAEIQKACEWLAKNNIRLVWGPGRHIIGHNIAIYHRNADKVRVEFFTEMDQMKDEALGYFDPRPWHADRPQRPKVWSRDNRAVAGWGPPPTADYHLNRDD